MLWKLKGETPNWWKYIREMYIFTAMELGTKQHIR